MKWVITLIMKAVNDKFTGSIQINFSKGTIKNVNKNETLRDTDE